MADAKQAVQEAVAKIPAEICARFDTAAKLSDEDRKAIIALATTALAPFLPEAEETPKASTASA
jgi:F-type H+-transporting ATPase subunit alpha